MDALRIDFGITKTNQSGDKPETRLLLTNLALPFICPVTNLALYLATLSGNAKDNELLFEGGQQASHFQKTLRSAIESEELKCTMQTLGLLPEDYGAHSIRKGAGTYLSNGGTCGPTYTSICIRMGGVAIGDDAREISVFYGAASDAFCGRILSLWVEPKLNRFRSFATTLFHSYST
jgi:hypothetical protein